MSDQLADHDLDGVGADDVWITAPELRRRWKKSHMWLHRQLQRPDSPLHQPFYVNGKRHWMLSWVIAAERKFAGED